MINKYQFRDNDSRFTIPGDINVLQRINNYNISKKKNKEFILGMILGLIINIFSFLFLIFFKSKHLKQGIIVGFIYSILLIVLLFSAFLIDMKVNPVVLTQLILQ